MNLLDVLLLLAVLVFSVSGYQRGLVAGFVSLAGFVGGAVIGVWLLPHVLEKVQPGTTDLKKAGQYAEVGQLKTFSGSVDLKLPKGVNVADYKSVLLWCDQVATPFGTAALK